MTNVERARHILMELFTSGVGEIVSCPGARNAPFVAQLSQVAGIRVHSFFEERSAGFFAIGRMQAEGRPVVVCTTSGTAVAELLPAVIEADYQGLPLIVLSADRPKSFRGTGSPQTIVQPGIFSHYVEKSWDLTADPDFSDFHLAIGNRPLHINVCFDEPLIDGPIATLNCGVGEGPKPFAPGAGGQERPSSEWLGSLAQVRSPVVIVGRLSRSDSKAVKETLLKWKRPVYLEGHSQLRGDPELAHLEILGGEETIPQMNIDGVIRIGDVPTLKFWRNLERSQLPVWNFSVRGFSGLARQREVFALDSLGSVTAMSAEFEPWTEEERERDLQRAEKLNGLLAEFPFSEAAWFKKLSLWIPPNAKVLLGNSLPVREWDLAADRECRPEVFGNRGTNGIDGLVSTFLGVAGENTSNWGVIGDLSALYDLSGPWALRGLNLKDVNLVVINNGGGKIFERIFNNELFENRHALNFEGWADMWGWNYQRLDNCSSARDLTVASPRLLEIVPDSEATRAFLNAWERLKC